MNTPKPDSKEQNPYSPPIALIVAKQTSSAGFIVGKNKSIFIPNGSHLPARCIKCNQPVNMMTKKKLYKHSLIYIVSAFIIFMVLIKLATVIANSILETVVQLAPFILFALAYFFRRKTVIDIGICDRHLAYNKKVKTVNLLCITFMLGTILLLVSHIHSINTKVLVFIFIAMPLFSLIASLFITDISVVSIKKDGIKLRGFNVAFLASLR